MAFTTEMEHNVALASSESPQTAVLYLSEMNVHSSYMQLMYGKYTLFYEFPQNWGCYTHAQTVCTRPILGGEGPVDEASIFTDCGRIQKWVRFAFILVIIIYIILMCEILSQCINPNILLFYLLVIQSEESEVQTETKPDEDKPGGCYNWSNF